jgi:hypothetical protein
MIRPWRYIIKIQKIGQKYPFDIRDIDIDHYCYLPIPILIFIFIEKADFRTEVLQASYLIHGLRIRHNVLLHVQDELDVCDVINLFSDTLQKYGNHIINHMLHKPKISEK